MTDEEVARRALACLDLTDLSDSCEETDVELLCARASTPWGDVAAVCVWPKYVKDAKALLGASRIMVATVANFPEGRDDAEAAAAEAEAARADGADEIDLVLPWRAFVEGREDAARDVVRAVKGVLGSRPLKVILESGELADPERVRAAAALAVDAGADFLKTSTGKTRGGATPEHAEAMLDAIAATAHPVGLKVSGGVRTLQDARAYLELAERRMGAGWAAPEHFRIGASGLLGALAKVLDREGEARPAEDDASGDD
jgi:deoxyribose-phosphate aldolase